MLNLILSFLLQVFLSINSYYKFNIHNNRLAQDLFLRLCETDLSKRYTAELALQHPWITRKIGQPIPLTIFEENTIRKNTLDLSAVLKASFYSIYCLNKSKEKSKYYIDLKKNLIYDKDNNSQYKECKLTYICK